MDCSISHLVQVKILIFPDCIFAPWAAQFNYLLEQRDKLTEELNRFESARREGIVQEEGGQTIAGDTSANEAIAKFIASSEFIDEAAARKIAAV